MKKFLSILGVSILSFSLFTGCGGATADDVQEATENFLSTCVSIGTKVAELDADAQAEFQQELQDLQTKLTEDVAAIDADDYDAQLSAIEDIETQFKELADSYGIDVE